MVILFEILFIPLVAFGIICNAFGEDQISARVQYGQGLTGATRDTSSQDLQPYSKAETNFVLGYDFDKTRNSVFFEGGYAMQSTKFRLYADGNPSSFDKYSLAYNYYFFKAGYDFYLGNIQFTPGIRLGTGNYTISGDNSDNKTGSAFLRGIELNFQGTIAESNYFYTVGLGYSEVSFAKFNSINKDIDKDRVFISINLGLGYNF